MAIDSERISAQEKKAVRRKEKRESGMGPIVCGGD